jgi:hypothetical protein
MGKPRHGSRAPGLDYGSISHVHGVIRRIIIIFRFNKRGKIRRKGKMRELFQQEENVAKEKALLLRGVGPETSVHCLA